MPTNGNINQPNGGNPNPWFNQNNNRPNTNRKNNKRIKQIKNRRIQNIQ